MAWNQMLESLQMIRHCFLLCIILLSQPVYWIATFLRQTSWYFYHGKWVLIHIQQNKLKRSQRNDPGLMFNNNIVNLAIIHKHLGMIFEVKLRRTFKDCQKIIKTVGLLWKSQGILPRTSFITIYKSFVRPHLDYGDIIYYQTFNESVHQRIESIPYNAAIAITGANIGTSSKKIYQELDLESLGSRRWLRKLCLFYKIYKNKSPSNLYNLIPDKVKFYSTRSSQIDNISSMKTRSNFSFFPSTITEWNKLGHASAIAILWMSLSCLL